MATNDYFDQESGDPGTTIDKDDVGITYWIIQHEIGDAIDNVYFLSSTGEVDTGTSLGDTTRMPWVEVWVQDIGDDRQFVQCTNAGQVFADAGGFTQPASGYSFYVFYDTTDDVWCVRITHGSTDTNGTDLVAHPESKRIVWIHVIWTT